MDMPTDGNQEPPQSPEEVIKPEPPEGAKAEQEEAGQQPQSPEEVITPEPFEGARAEQEEAGQQPEKSRLSGREEALADMRRSLREEEPEEETGFRASVRKFLARIFPRKAAPVEETTDTPSRLDALQFPEPAPKAATPPEPALPAEAGSAEHVPAHETARPGESKAAFESMVEARLTNAFREREDREAPTLSAFVQPPADEPVVEEEAAAPGKSILATLRQEDQEATEEPSVMREEALQEYTLEPEEPQQEKGSPVVRNLRRSWRYMRPMERRLLIAALIIVGLFALAGSGFLVVKSIPTPTPVVTPTTSIVPIPISVSLPGGWVFPLRTGFVQNGKWTPKSAEWLQGTEVCRWVSLPWTVQLEAVLRTLKADDPIQLSMSNYDSILYKVKSIEQVPSGDIAKLASDSPCLLLILSKDNSDARWVVTAKP